MKVHEEDATSKDKGKQEPDDQAGATVQEEGRGLLRTALLLGCGNSRERRINVPGDPLEGWGGYKVTTLDMYPGCNPDVVHDLEALPYPFPDDTFDRIDAYEVLEHIGAQGDFKAMFSQFSELWRILKPGGHLCATVPAFSDVGTWGDPGHRRVINAMTIAFLDQAKYTENVGKTTMADYRTWYRADFETAHLMDGGETFGFILRAVKPSRVSA